MLTENNQHSTEATAKLGSGGTQLYIWLQFWTELFANIPQDKTVSNEDLVQPEIRYIPCIFWLWSQKIQSTLYACILSTFKHDAFCVCLFLMLM